MSLRQRRCELCPQEEEGTPSPLLNPEENMLNPKCAEPQI